MWIDLGAMGISNGGSGRSVSTSKQQTEPEEPAESNPLSDIWTETSGIFNTQSGAMTSPLSGDPLAEQTLNLVGGATYEIAGEVEKTAGSGAATVLVNGQQVVSTTANQVFSGQFVATAATVIVLTIVGASALSRAVFTGLTVRRL